MDIAVMHWEWKLRFNKVNSNYKKDFTPQEIDSFINTASTDLFEICYSGNNVKQYKLGFEVTQQKLDMLSNFVVPECIEPTLIDEACGIYEVPFADLEQPYVHLLRAYFNYNCIRLADNTVKCKTFNIKVEQHDDLNTVLEDAFRKSSFKWKRLVGAIRQSTDSINDSSLFLYTENEFTNVKLSPICLDYLTCPKQVYLGKYDQDNFKYDGYDSLEFLSTGIGYKKGDAPVSSNWPKGYHSLLVDMAVQEANRVLGYAQDVALQDPKINRVIQ